MYLKEGKLFRVFALKVQLADPQETESVISEVEDKLKDIANEIIVDSPMVTYDREEDKNTNVILNLYLHLSNSQKPELIRLSEITESLSDSIAFKLLNIKID
ncbi:hypothetical protein [Dendrosporobacter sp. 1207_IL3150]|uniref:hypothetical protein n=1 Tax=Dendrosporobacter sp. 1207_IL3150 TaxID=3084054 RepID=UPI002FD8D0E5